MNKIFLNLREKKTTWDELYAIPLAQDAYSIFANHINNYFQEFQLKNVKISWIGAELKKEITQKNKLLATFKRFPTEENKSARNIVISKLRIIRQSANTMMNNSIYMAMITIRNGMLSKKLLPKKIDLLQCNLNLLLIMIPLPIL